MKTWIVTDKAFHGGGSFTLAMRRSRKRFLTVMSCRESTDGFAGLAG
jgi:hypothetical protein